MNNKYGVGRKEFMIAQPMMKSLAEINKDISERQAKVHKKFYAKDNYEMPVMVELKLPEGTEPTMAIDTDEGFIYITKQQAKDFFGL